MEKFSQNPQITWQWLPLGYCATGEGSVAIAGEGALKDVLDIILTSLLPPECFSSEQLVDISSGEAKLILRIVGEIEKSSEDSEEKEWIQFQVGLKAEFKEFQGSHHIVHSIKWHKSEEVSDISVREFTLREVIRISEIELNLAFFESRFTSLFGFSPVAIRGISLLAKEGQVEWIAWVEGQRNKEAALEKFANLVEPISRFEINNS